METPDASLSPSLTEASGASHTHTLKTRKVCFFFSTRPLFCKVKDYVMQQFIYRIVCVETETQTNKGIEPGRVFFFFNRVIYIEDSKIRFPHFKEQQPIASLHATVGGFRL